MATFTVKHQEKRDALSATVCFVTYSAEAHLSLQYKRLDWSLSKKKQGEHECW